MDKEAIKTYSYRISTANRSELIVIMYDMTIEYLQDALKCENLEEYNNNIKLAKRVVDKLVACLDMKYDISKQLLNFYMCVGRLLVKSQAARDDAAVSRAIVMLERMRKSFYEVSKQDQSDSIMKNTQQVYAGLTYSRAGGSNEISTDSVKNRGYIV